MFDFYLISFIKQDLRFHVNSLILIWECLDSCTGKQDKNTHTSSMNINEFLLYKYIVLLNIKPLCVYLELFCRTCGDLFLLDPCSLEWARDDDLPLLQELLLCRPVPWLLLFFFLDVCLCRPGDTEELRWRFWPRPRWCRLDEWDPFVLWENTVTGLRNGARYACFSSSRDLKELSVLVYFGIYCRCFS